MIMDHVIYSNAHCETFSFDPIDVTLNAGDGLIQQQDLSTCSDKYGDKFALEV